MKIALPDVNGHMSDYSLSGKAIPQARLAARPARGAVSLRRGVRSCGWENAG